MSAPLLAHQYQGPLDLLWEAVQQGAVELTTVSLAGITRDYLNRLSQLHHPEPSQLSAFVELGARLVYLKSQALLPQPEQTTSEPLEIETLSHQLHDYQVIKQQAAALRAQAAYSTWRRPNRNRPTPKTTTTKPTRPANLQLSALQAAYTAIIKRQPKIIPSASQPLMQFTLDQAINQIQHQLTTGRTSLNALTATAPTVPRYQVIVIFLAILELVKQGHVSIIEASASPWATQLELAHD